MHRIFLIVTLVAGLFLLPAAPVSAWFFDDTLVTIDGTKYSDEAFKRWWKYWNTEDEPLPETPDIYIDWLLLSREGKRMQLDEEPAFKRATRVFLQARGLLMLKNEAVDSKIDVTEEQIKERYEQEYTPRWLVQRMVFADEDTAAAAWEELSSEAITVEELAEQDAEEGGPEKVAESWVRPVNIDPGWVELFSATAVGSTVDPEGHDQGPVLYYIKEQQDGDADDFQSRKKSIQRELRRSQERDLTQQLLQELYEKYQVQVDQERIDNLDLTADDSTFSDEPVITTSRENVTEKEFVAVIRRLQQSRPTAAHAAFDPEQAEQLKNETVDNIIAQSLTNWESLDREFEEREPFKWEYQFNYDHRLTLAVEKHQFADSVIVSDEQVQERYEQNMERYTQPETLKLYIIDETQAPVDRFWAEVATGKDFRQLLRDHFEQRVSPQEVPVNHIAPDVREVAEQLSKGETSPVFVADGIKVMVHLHDRIPERPLPLAQVKDSIRRELRSEMMEEKRQDYLDALRSHSQIEVDSGEWRSLQRELGGK